MSKTVLLTTIIASTFVIGMLVGSMPATIPLADAVRGDDDLSNEEIAKRLGKVVKILTKANNRLDKISAVGTTPPDDATPQILANADNVITLANDIIAEANVIKANAGGVLGCPPGTIGIPPDCR